MRFLAAGLASLNIPNAYTAVMPTIIGYPHLGRNAACDHIVDVEMSDRLAMLLRACMS